MKQRFRGTFYDNIIGKSYGEVVIEYNSIEELEQKVKDYQNRNHGYLTKIENPYKYYVIVEKEIYKGILKIEYENENELKEKLLKYSLDNPFYNLIEVPK